ncbi:MAG TPA: hypothetical protein VHN15_07025 [Thermoanaerobaculia bacterium]|jgi:hypothetical protein|nr:hypothetical protein [Thermoanaerobaculia bacterium]
MKKMEKVNGELFKNLTEEEAQLVAGGAEGTGEVTYSSTGDWDAKADIRFPIRLF